MIRFRFRHIQKGCRKLTIQGFIWFHNKHISSCSYFFLMLRQEKLKQYCVCLHKPVSCFSGICCASSIPSKYTFADEHYRRTCKPGITTQTLMVIQRGEISESQNQTRLQFLYDTSHHLAYSSCACTHDILRFSIPV